MRSRLPVIVLTILGFSCMCLAVPVGSCLQVEEVPGTMPQIHRLHLPADLVEHGVYPPLNDVNIQTSTVFSSPPVPSFSSVASPPPSLVAPSQFQVDQPSHTSSADPLQQPVFPSHIQMAPARQDHLYRRWRQMGVDPQPRIINSFEILGGLIGITILILCGRSIQHYYRMPRRDLASEHIDRYNLERELADLEEVRLRINSPTNASAFCPPPPYREAPPYDEVMKEVTSASPNERRGS